jgi:hypothetical protein
MFAAIVSRGLWCVGGGSTQVVVREVRDIRGGVEPEIEVVGIIEPEIEVVGIIEPAFNGTASSVLRSQLEQDSDWNKCK